MIEVDPRHTSDRCEACGHAAKENRVTQAEFACRRCGQRTHADENAARNILRAGLARYTATLLEKKLTATAVSEVTVGSFSGLR